MYRQSSPSEHNLEKIKWNNYFLFEDDFENLVFCQNIIFVYFYFLFLITTKT